MRPSVVLVARIAARHRPPTAASLLRTVRAASYGPVVPTKAVQPGCPLDDPSFAAAVSTCSPVRKGATASLIHRPRSRNGKKVTARPRSFRAGPFGARAIPFASTGSAGNREPDVFVWSVD
ncbi:MAG: hypothetical protein LKH81_01890 [Acetobacter sp.]|nr:hypothetical protein [Acetobacter sp.]MCI1528752.1 hypothetical protein [Acetobacter sp.]MCI1586644.1 hypothetical protein [Acetobacter sp.]MCI1701242.1 hypothetical protein [Acetobacter sp.]